MLAPTPRQHHNMVVLLLMCPSMSVWILQFFLFAEVWAKPGADLSQMPAIQAAEAPAWEERVSGHSMGKAEAPAPSSLLERPNWRNHELNQTSADGHLTNTRGYQLPTTCRPPQIPLSTSIHCGTSQCGGGTIGMRTPVSPLLWDVDGGRYTAGIKGKVKTANISASPLLQNAYFLRYEKVQNIFTIRSKVSPSDSVCVAADNALSPVYDKYVLWRCDDNSYMTVNGSAYLLNRFSIECGQCKENSNRITTGGYVYATACLIKDPRGAARKCIIPALNAQLSLGECTTSAYWNLRSY